MRWSIRSSSVGIARTMVSSPRNEKLPLAMSQRWKNTVMSPAIEASGWGAKYAKGTTSSVK